MFRLLLVWLLPTSAWAVPGTLVHSGRLIDTNGQGLNGPLAVTVHLYDASNASIWSEAHTLTLEGGYFAVVLGAATPVPPAILDDAAEVVIVSGAMELHQPLHSVPSALAVEGAVRLTNTTDSCGGGDVGLLRYDGGLEVCSASGWQGVASAGGAVTQSGPVTLAWNATTTVTGTSVVGVYEEGGPYTADSFTKFLLHADGAAAAFVDSALSKPVTANGNATQSTTQSRFGGSSAYFDGTGDWLSSPNDTDLTFGTGAFTVDFWMYAQSGSLGGTPVSKYASGGNHDWIIEVDANGFVKFRSYDDAGVTIQQVTGNTSVIGAWHHIAAARNGSTLRLFVDGQQQGSMTSTMNFNNAQPLVVGRYTDVSDYSYFQGWIDELRLSKGIARWEANFTPPTPGGWAQLRPGTDYDVTRSSASGAQTLTIRRTKTGTGVHIIDTLP